MGMTYRLDDPTSAIGTGGLTYDTQTRSLIAPAYRGQVFAVDATSSKWEVAFWSSSGASFWNGLAALQADFVIQFNEVSHGLQQTDATRLPSLLMVLSSRFLSKRGHADARGHWFEGS
jgi:hypothetical protein